MLPSRNIPIACARSFFVMFLVVVPVLVPYWRSLGLSMREVIELQAIFGLAVAIFEAPTGYVADIWGRKASVVLGGLISGLGFSLLPFATTYWELLLFEVGLALGCSLSSGAIDALIYESIPAGRSRKQVIGAVGQWSLVGEAAAALAASGLVLWSFSAVVWAQVVVGWVPFVLALFFVEPPREPMVESSHRERFMEVMREVFTKDSLTRLVFVNYVAWALSTFSAVWLLQEYWRQVGLPLGYFGLLWGALHLVAAVVSRIAHRIESMLGAQRTLTVIACLPIAAYLLMAWAPTGVGVASGVLFYVSRGLTMVVYQDAFNWRIRSTFRATANSLQSLGFRLGFAPIGFVVGSVVDVRGLPAAFSLLAAGFSLCGVLLLRPMIRRIDELHVEYIPEPTEA